MGLGFPGFWVQEKTRKLRGKTRKVGFAHDIRIFVVWKNAETVFFFQKGFGLRGIAEIDQSLGQVRKDLKLRRNPVDP